MKAVRRFAVSGGVAEVLTGWDDAWQVDEKSG